MSERNLPDWLDGYMTLVENSEPPESYHLWSAISSIAAALQRKVRIELGLSITIYPNFYIVLVGPSATGKGTAMGYAADIIKHVPNIRLSAQATSLQALIRRMKETNLTDIDMDTGKQQYHSSMTIFSEEFTVFLGYHNRELIAALCDWYDCKERWTYDTIKRDKEEVIGVWVNVLAGTTPDSLQSSLPVEAIGAGLTSRIIFVVEEKRKQLVIFPGSSRDLQQMLIEDLSQIALMSGCFKLTEKAAGYYSSWCYEADAEPPFLDPKFDGYCGRRRNHLNSLAMVCSASRSNELIVTEDDFVRANNILKATEVKMGTVFKGMGKSDIASLIFQATAYLENSFVDEMPTWQFARHFEGDMDKFTLDRVLSTLCSTNQIEVIRRPGCDQMVKINRKVKVDC